MRITTFCICLFIATVCSGQFWLEAGIYYNPITKFRGDPITYDKGIYFDNQFNTYFSRLAFVPQVGYKGFSYSYAAYQNSYFAPLRGLSEWDLLAIPFLRRFLIYKCHNINYRLPFDRLIIEPGLSFMSITDDQMRLILLFGRPHLGYSTINARTIGGRLRVGYKIFENLSINAVYGVFRDRDESMYSGHNYTMGLSYTYTFRKKSK